MRDQMDAMLWNEHHDQFSHVMNGAIVALGLRFRRGAGLGRAVPAQLLAAVAALGLTLATLGASTV